MTEEKKGLSPFLTEGWVWNNEDGFWLVFDSEGKFRLCTAWASEHWNTFGLLHPSEGGGFQSAQGICYDVDVLWSDGAILRNGLRGEARDGEGKLIATEIGWRPHFANSEREEATSKNSQKMPTICEPEAASAHGFVDGRWYRHSTEHWFGRYFAHIRKVVNSNTGKWATIDTPKEWTPCNPDGSPIAPEPAVGQVWKLKDRDLEVRINVVRRCDASGSHMYILVDHAGNCYGGYNSLEEAVEGFTFVREGNK